jgi:hypothetical protein
MVKYGRSPPAMPIRVISDIRPYNGSEFPVTSDDYIRGGYRVVETRSSLDGIPAQHRKAGMLAYVQDADATYRLDRDMLTWLSLDSAIKTYIDNQIKKALGQG